VDADDLYGLPLAEFTRARDALARQLRKDGEKEEAARVAALRKPPLPAWAVNAVARAHPREVDLLLDASHRLVEAQTGRAAHEDVTAAVWRQRKAVAELTDLAGRLLGERATPATMARVFETLRSAALTLEGRALLARGVLDRELSTTGWEIVEAAGVALPQPREESKPSRAPSAKAKAAAERKARIAEATAVLAAARDELEAARGRAREADAAVREAEQALAAARREAADAQDDVDSAGDRVADAEEALARAREHGA
jgi:hypothetical protein